MTAGDVVASIDVRADGAPARPLLGTTTTALTAAHSASISERTNGEGIDDPPTSELHAR
jgi:hypothetical protein